MRCNTLATTGDFPVQHTEKANASSGLNKGFQCQMHGVHFETLKKVDQIIFFKNSQL